MNDSASDEVLVSRSLHGDRDAFDALVRRHYRAGFAVAMAFTNDRADAEDVCHDAFVAAGARLGECRDPSRFSHWLCAIVRNRARNAMTRGFSHRATPLDDNAVAANADAARDVERRELAGRLTQALSGLSPMQRQVVLLHDMEGWTHEAIADFIGTSPGMSRQHLFHARRRLREALGRDTSREYFQ